MEAKTQNEYTLTDCDEERVRLKKQALNLYGGLGYLDAYMQHQSSVLDVGCGTGDLIHNYAAKYPNTTFYGVDINAEAVSRCNASSNYKTTHFLVGNANNLPFTDQMFDIVHARFLLMHTDDPLNIILEMKRVLRSKGKIVLHEGFHDAVWIEPNCYYFNKVLTAWKKMMSDRKQDHSIGLRLYAHLAKCGFQNVQCQLLSHGFGYREPEFYQYINNWLAHIPALKFALSKVVDETDFIKMESELRELTKDCYYAELTALAVGQR